MKNNTLPFRTHLGYGFGDLGQNLVFQSIAIFLLPYFTDVMGLSPALAGLIFLIARPFDGITDPLMGYWAQRHQSRWGTFRPFLLYAAIPGALCFVALFSAPTLEGNWTFVYALGMYLLFSIFFTAFNIPYAALTAVMTEDYNERGKLTGFRMTFALIGGIIAGYVTPELLGISGYQGMAGIYAGILVFCLLVAFFSVRERPHTAKAQQTSLAETFKMLKGNRPFWIVTLTFSSCFASALSFSGMVQYYFTYYVGDTAIMGLGLLCFSGATAIAIPFWTWLSTQTSKKTALIIGLCVSIVAYIGLFSLGAEQANLLLVLLGLHGIGNGAAAFASWAMPADTIEYGEWKSGVRAEGMTFGVYGVFLKIGMAIGSSLIGLGLSWVGYVALANQSPETLLGIRALMTLLPAFFLLIALGSMWTYQLSPQKHAKIRAELNQKEA
ncbi:MAG: MFS transporter [Bacteroidota bacterium]